MKKTQVGKVNNARDFIASEFYAGQGLGNQLWVYAFVRRLANLRNCNYSFKNPGLFKGIKFLDLDFGLEFQDEWNLEIFNELGTYSEELKSIVYDDIEAGDIPQKAFVKGNLQSVKFIYPDFQEISNWTQCKDPKDLISLLDEKTCILNVRGGDYLGRKDLLLYPDYWIKAMSHMTRKFGDLTFKIVTDDYVYAKKILPDLEVIRSDIQGDYFVLQNAPFLILSNSSFAFFPAWTNQNLRYCLAPKYWAGHNRNLGWISPYNLVQSWNYIDCFGEVSKGYDLELNLNPSESENKERDLRRASEYRDKGKFDRLRTKFYVITVKNVKFEFSSSLNRVRVRASGILKTKWKLQYTKICQFLRIVKKIDMKFRHLLRKIPWDGKDKLWLFSLIPQRYSLSTGNGFKVLDVFYFHNEVEILRLRVEVLKNYVDYFVIVESETSYMGLPKTPIAKNICSEFEDIQDKFIYLVATNVPNSISEVNTEIHRHGISLKRKLILSRLLKSPSIPLTDGPSQWVREYFIKEFPSVALDELGENDYVFISDVDEIWNPKSRFRSPRGRIQLFRQKSYHYFLNNRCLEDFRNWSGSVLVDGKTFQDIGPDEIRSHRINSVSRSVIAHGGWHFTSQGPMEVIKEKFMDAQWFQTPIDWNAEIPKLIKNRQSFRGREYKFRVEEKGLPEFILQNRERFKNMLLKKDIN